MQQTAGHDDLRVLMAKRAPLILVFLSSPESVDKLGSAASQVNAEVRPSPLSLLRHVGQILDFSTLFQ